MPRKCTPGDPGEINPRLQASAYNYSVLLRACRSNQHCLSFTVWPSPTGHSWVPGWFTNPPEGLATLYGANYQRRLAYNLVRADLAFSGPPLLLPRIPPEPGS
jgi:endo-1,4-beta-xylanase